METVAQWRLQEKCSSVEAIMATQWRLQKKGGTVVAWVVGHAVQPLLNVTDFSQHRISKCLCYFGDC